MLVQPYMVHKEKRITDLGNQTYTSMPDFMVLRNLNDNLAT